MRLIAFAIFRSAAQGFAGGFGILAKTFHRVAGRQRQQQNSGKGETLKGFVYFCHGVKPPLLKTLCPDKIPKNSDRYQGVVEGSGTAGGGVSGISAAEGGAASSGFRLPGGGGA